EKVQAGTGKKPMIYVGKYFWQSYVASSAFKSYPLWIANWFTDCPDLPNAWSDWVFWQHSDAGSVPGIDGSVDLDRYNGDLSSLEHFAGKVYGAKLVSAKYPATMAPGETGTAKIVVENVGGKTWGTKTRLGTTAPRDRKSKFATAAWVADDRPDAV